MTLRTGKRRSAEPRCRAFTLIELILVMALLAIVIAVAAPSLSNFFRGRTLDSEARRFLSLTRYAQSRAASEGVPVVLWIDVRNRSYGVEEDAGYNEGIDTKAMRYQMGEDLRVEVGNKLARATQQTVRNLPVLRFLPDGSISTESVEGVSFHGRDEDTLWIVLSRNGLNYEIRDQNTMRQARR